MTAIIADTETHALVDPIPIEVAWARFTPRPEPIWSTATVRRYNPGKPISFGAMSTHHIMDADVSGEPLWVGPWTPPEGTLFMIAHNVDFDHGALGKPAVRLICTLALARVEWPDLDSHKLGALIYLIRGADAKSIVPHAHSAAADVDMCAIVMSELVTRHPEWNNWNAIYAASQEARIPKKMSFGKHEGMLIENLPKDYVSWMRRQADMDQCVMIAVNRYHR